MSAERNAPAAALMAPSNTLGGYVSDRLGNPPLVIGACLAGVALAVILARMRQRGLAAAAEQ